MMISLVLAFRDRVDTLEQMVTSIMKTALNPQSIEILLAMDHDDRKGKEGAVRLAQLNRDLTFRMYFFERSNHFTKDYVNPLARLAEGRWIINLNDDAVFLQLGWDVELNSKMAEAALKFEDDILLGLPKDGINREGEDPLFPHFTCFPVVSKEYVQRSGEFLDERFKIWGPDHYIAQVFKKVGRLVSLTEEVTIHHKSYHTDLSLPKGNYDRFMEIDRRNPVVVTEQMRRDSAARVQTIIKEIHNARDNQRR